MTLLDKILVYLLGSFLIYLAIKGIVGNIVISVFITFLIVVLMRSLFIHIYIRHRKKSVISTSEMENEFALMGGDQADFIMNTVSDYYKPEKAESGFFVTKNGNKTYVATNFKFSSSGIEDVARFYRYAKKEHIYRIEILGKTPPRNVYVFANSLDIFIKFIPSKKLHSYLENRNALMPKRKILKTHKKFNFALNFQSSFTKRRAKYFALSGLWLAIPAAIGIMRVYYIIMCCICFVLSVICLLKRE